MKKLLLLIIIFISITLSSCDLLTTYSITVKNESGNGILMNITQSTSIPSPFIPIADNDSLVFSDLGGGNGSNYYLHVKSSGDSFYRRIDMVVNQNETWTVVFNYIDSQYEVLIGP